MATGVQTWSKTAASNATADSAVNWAEGQAPSSVNDSARGGMASVAKWRDDISGTITTGGSSTAYTVTSNQSFASLAALDGAQIAFIPHATSGASPTLAVDGLTAKQIRMSTGVNVPTGGLLIGTPYVVTYYASAAEYIVQGVPGAGGAWLQTGSVPTAALADDAVTYAKIQNVSATSRVLGRKTSGAGDTEELTYSEVLDFVGSATRGDILSRGASTWDRVAKGTTGQVLTQGANDPAWATPTAYALTLISAQTASSSATIDFSSGLDDTYDRYMVLLSNVKPATDDVELWLRVGTGGGPTYQTSGYRYITRAYNDTGSDVSIASASDSKINLVSASSTVSLGNASGENANITIHFNNPEVTDLCEFNWHGGYSAAYGGVANVSGSGRYDTAGAITAIRFLMESGNIASGTFRLYGYRKS